MQLLLVKIGAAIRLVAPRPHYHYIEETERPREGYALRIKLGRLVAVPPLSANTVLLSDKRNNLQEQRDLLAAAFIHRHRLTPAPCIRLTANDKLL